MVGDGRRQLAEAISSVETRRDKLLTKAIASSALRDERSDRGEENRASQVPSNRKSGFPEEARSAERRIAKRYGAQQGWEGIPCARVGGGGGTQPAACAPGGCHTGPAEQDGVARLILLSRSEAR